MHGASEIRRRLLVFFLNEVRIAEALDEEVF